MLAKALKIGDIVASKKGHDTNRMYVVIGINLQFAFVADGEKRPINNPKKKRLSHLRFVSNCQIEGEFTDTLLKRIIKLTKQALAKKAEQIKN